MLAEYCYRKPTISFWFKFNFPFPSFTKSLQNHQEQESIFTYIAFRENQAFMFFETIPSIDRLGVDVTTSIITPPYNFTTCCTLVGSTFFLAFILCLCCVDVNRVDFDYICVLVIAIWLYTEAIFKDARGYENEVQKVGLKCSLKF